METKLNFKEIVPANDILEDEMEFVKGGTDFNLCFKGAQLQISVAYFCSIGLYFLV